MNNWPRSQIMKSNRFDVIFVTIVNRFRRLKKFHAIVNDRTKFLLTKLRVLA